MKKRTLIIIVAVVVVVMAAVAAYAYTNQAVAVNKTCSANCANFTDANKDGVCDAAAKCHKDGKCDPSKCGTKCDKSKCGQMKCDPSKCSNNQGAKNCPGHSGGSCPGRAK